MNDKKLGVRQLTEEEIKQHQELEQLLAQKARENTKQAADKIVKFLGIVLATILFLISFSMLAPLTIFSRLFGLKAADVWRGGLPSVFSSGSIYYAFIGPSPTVAILIMTVVQVSLAVLLAFLISLYVRDIIVVIKGVLKIGRNITTEIGVGVEEGLEEVGVKKGGKKVKKPLFDENEKTKPEDYDLLKEDKPKVSKKEEKLLKEIEELGGLDKPVQEEPVRIETVETSTLTESEVNKQIDSILSDQSLSTEEAQRQVGELVKLLPNNGKKQLF